MMAFSFKFSDSSDSSMTVSKATVSLKSQSYQGVHAAHDSSDSSTNFLAGKNKVGQNRIMYLKFDNSEHKHRNTVRSVRQTLKALRHRGLTLMKLSEYCQPTVITVRKRLCT